MNNFFFSNSFPPPAPGIHPHTQFLALLAHKNWTPGSRNYRRASAAFNSALIDEFSVRFGDNPKPDLAAWQNLCLALGVKDVPPSITQCKKTVKRTHVNLVDLMTGHIRTFRSREELMEHTKVTGRYFPRKEAKERGGGLLRCLLREMLEQGLDEQAMSTTEATEGTVSSV